MYPMIVCTCGRPLGDIYDLYKAMVIDKALNLIHQKKMSLSEIPKYLEEGTGDILEKLGFSINDICCRTRLITQIEFKDYY